MKVRRVLPGYANCEGKGDDRQKTDERGADSGRHLEVLLSGCPDRVDVWEEFSSEFPLSQRHTW